ncbi:MAG TPA: hypothetical protein VNN25_19090, partial [Thermoanaerobaculia bacterium]|nr:hypothetical protein [Thermoanaerobaculia bacterium]
TFVPNFLLAWFFLSATGISRLSLGYIALNALLAADGMDVIASFVTLRWRALRRESLATALQMFLAAIVIGRYIFWVWPALEEVRTKDSPPVLAMRWIREHVPGGTTIYLNGALEPFPEYFLPDYRIVSVDADFDPSRVVLQPGAFVVSDAPSRLADAVNFQRPHRRLWALFNQRYFETSVAPAAGWIKFGDGWYNEEDNGQGVWWRWMRSESHTLLGPLGHPAQLGVTLGYPDELEPAPKVVIALDGNVIDRFVVPRGAAERSYAVSSRSGASDELVISVDRTVNPLRAHRGPDSRDLGLRLLSLTWKAR